MAKCMCGQAYTPRKSAGQSVVTPEGLKRETDMVEILWEGKNFKT